MRKTIIPKVEVIDGKFYVDGEDVTPKVYEEITRKIEEIEVINTATELKLYLRNITIPIGTIRDLKDNKHD